MRKELENPHILGRARDGRKDYHLASRPRLRLRPRPLPRRLLLKVICIRVISCLVRVLVADDPLKWPQAFMASSIKLALRRLLPLEEALLVGVSSSTHRCASFWRSGGVWRC